MLPADLRMITQAHLHQMVADRVREGPHLDFKRDLPRAWNDAAKHELVADATAFANAGGGDLIYGLDEDGDATAAAIVPQPIANPDQETRRVQDMLLTNSEPRLPGCQVVTLPVTVDGTRGHAMVVRVPQSWGGPHRVKINNHFYIRDGLRKRPLDVPEIRAMFNRSELQAQRVANFRTGRLGKILSGEGPRMVRGPALVLHLVPTQAMLGQVQIDPIQYTNLTNGHRYLPLIGATGNPARINLDGALALRNMGADDATHGYSLLFRSGFFEATYALTGRNDGAAVLPSVTYEQNLTQLLGRFRTELAHLGINGECAVMLSLLRAHEVVLGVRDRWGYNEPHQGRFDREVVALPDSIAAVDDSPERALRPVFDALWQAAGFEGSRNYNEAGEWAPPQ